MVFRKLLSRIQCSAGNDDPPESVYFYTFHKCASTLFSRDVLNKVKGLKHVDYAAEIFQGARASNEPLRLQGQGHVYGPIRLSLDIDGPIYRLLVGPCSQIDFARDKTAVFLIRDPRDILVSSYYSFGFTHALSAVREIREGQQRQRDEIQKASIDSFVIERANAQIRHFKLADELSKACKCSVVLRYEDMVHDFDSFVSKFTKILPMKQMDIDKLYAQSRPRQIEEKGHHRRSGKTRAYHSKLKPETIDALNHQLKEILERFDYAVD